MNKVLNTLLLLLIGLVSNAQVFPVETIISNGQDDQRINFVILSDGYTGPQLSTFITDATNISNDVFNKSPFQEYAPFFNVYAVKVPSIESGADHPGTASDVSEPAHPVVDVQNYFGSTFDYFNIHRLLVPVNSSAVFNVLANSYAAYDQIIVLTNTPYYGGSGGIFATTSLENSAPEIAIHEIGHSFAGLADEYWAGDAYANEKPNMTANSNPATVKWSDWVGQGGINVYAHGSSGNQANWFRPHQSCEMRFLNQQFCAVCKETFIDKIYDLTDPIDNYSPSMGIVTYMGSPLNFSLDLVTPSPNTIKTIWLMNGVPIASYTDNITLNGGDIPQGNNTLEAQVIDTTLMSKSYAPASGYLFSQTWTVKNNILPVELFNFIALDRGTHVDLSWSVDHEQDIKNYEVQRSGNGIDYHTINTLQAKRNDGGPADYEMSDIYPLDGKNYYRIKIRESDDSYNFSPIRVIYRVEKFFFKIFPNPVSENLYLTYSNSTFSPNLLLEVISRDGRSILNTKLIPDEGTHQTRVDLSSLSVGFYYVRVKRGDFVQDFEIVKE